MRIDGAALDWSVVAVGGLLLAAVLVDWSHAADDAVTAAAERVLPTVLSAGLVGFGIWVRRRALSSRDLGTVALGALAGAVLFLIIDEWHFFIITLGRPAGLAGGVPGPSGLLGTEPLYPTLNLMAIGAVGNALLTALYLRFQHQNEELERLTEQLAERNRHLNDQTAKLRAQNDRLDQFASMVSHDLRNPLNVAAGRLEMARETGDSEHFEAVERSHDRMEALITETLSLARHGSTVEETEETGLAAVAESAWETVATGELTLTVVDDGRFDADASRLRQAFENLFRNAVEHGGAVSTVRVGALDGEEGFYVEDDGDGIPAGDREAVFEFGRSTATDGTGLGLAVVRAIVEAHGWHVEVTESEAGGARFEVTTGAADALDGREPVQTAESVS